MVAKQKILNNVTKISCKYAYTPNEHDEYALAFSTQKGTKESPFYSGADSFERYWRWPMWDKDSIYSFPILNLAPTISH